mmetsp:Transcript_30703/g.73096  ORF Transcript_30703/g.73096 Transcript_30703/m.73096 type:complete len:112 (-) Transcript_30703:630-965(-)
MGFFNHAVVLIVHHDNVAGSYGVVLNHRSLLAVRDASLRGSVHEVSLVGPLHPNRPAYVVSHGCAPEAQVLSANTLFVGGPVSLDTLHILGQAERAEGEVLEVWGPPKAAG